MGLNISDENQKYRTEKKMNVKRKFNIVIIIIIML